MLNTTLLHAKGSFVEVLAHKDFESWRRQSPEEVQGYVLHCEGDYDPSQSHSALMASCLVDVLHAPDIEVTKLNSKLAFDMLDMLSQVVNNGYPLATTMEALKHFEREDDEGNNVFQVRFMMSEMNIRCEYERPYDETLIGHTFHRALARVVSPLSFMFVFVFEFVFVFVFTCTGSRVLVFVFAQRKRGEKHVLCLPYLSCSCSCSSLCSCSCSRVRVHEFLCSCSHSESAEQSAERIVDA